MTIWVCSRSWCFRSCLYSIFCLQVKEHKILFELEAVVDMTLKARIPHHRSREGEESLTVLRYCSTHDDDGRVGQVQLSEARQHVRRRDPSRSL